MAIITNIKGFVETAADIAACVPAATVIAMSGVYTVPIITQVCFRVAEVYVRCVVGPRENFEGIQMNEIRDHQNPVQQL